MSSDDIIDLEDGWKKVKEDGIEPFLSFIENKERDFFKARDYVKLYDLIFKMCIQRDPYNWSEHMYQRYTQSILNYLLEIVRPSFNSACNSYEIAFLREWTTRWKNQKLIVKGLSKLFMYLDRFYTPNTDGVLALSEQGFKLYKENIFDQFSPYARRAILHSIEKERHSEEQDRDLLKEAVAVFVDIGYNYNQKKLKVYEAELEKAIVEHAGAFYKRKSREWMDEDSCPNYLEKAERMLNQEKKRVETYMNRHTLEPLKKQCYQRLLQDHQTELLEKKTGVFQMLSINAVEDLSRLYRLYSDWQKDLKPIADLVHAHIKKAGTECVDKSSQGRNQDANHQLVRNLIQLHAQYNKVVTECFDKAQVFQKSLKKAFEDFINKDNRVSKLLAKFVNDVLKKGTKVNIKDVESTLGNVVFLYGYIQEKDIFERDYQIHLSNRLLNGLCESEHAEKSMIAKLKTEAGYQWTNKLEGMFKDVTISKELMDKFKRQHNARDTDIQLDVNVCTTGYWPSSKVIPATLPDEVKKICDDFKQFYLNQQGGRKLEWRLDQGQGEISVAFSKNVKRGLILSTYQMMIMLVFNNQKVAAFKHIMQVTGIPRYEIQNHLLSLCHPKVGVLLKRPNKKELGDDDKFMVNPKYKPQLMNVVIPMMRTVEGDGKEREEEEKHVRLQRKHQMQAAIVRIMKARKTMRHNLLVAEVISQLQCRFPPKPTMIKKEIEGLIEMEYLERDKNNRGTYNYLA